MVGLTPARELGSLLGAYLHREQSIGETRGLRRLENLINHRKLELQQRLGLVKKPDPIETDYDDENIHTIPRS